MRFIDTFAPPTPGGVDWVRCQYALHICIYIYIYNSNTINQTALVLDGVIYMYGYKVIEIYK